MCIYVNWEVRQAVTVTHSAKSSQSAESHFNLKHRPVGVGSAEPTNHVPHDDVTPFYQHIEKVKKVQKKTYRRYLQRRPCLSSHVRALERRTTRTGTSSFQKLVSLPGLVSSAFLSVKIYRSRIWKNVGAKANPPPCSLSELCVKLRPVEAMWSFDWCCRGRDLLSDSLERELPWLAPSRLEIPTTERHVSDGKLRLWGLVEY